MTLRANVSKRSKADIPRHEQHSLARAVRNPISSPVSKADRPDQPNAAARFNEDAATYTVKEADAPELEAWVAAIPIS